MLAIRPSGTCSICSCVVASSNTVSLAMLAAVSALKKSMRASRPFNSLRDMVIGFPVSFVIIPPPPRPESGPRGPAAPAAQRAPTPFARHAPSGSWRQRWRRRRRARWRGSRRWPGCGWKACSCFLARGGAEEVGEQRAVVDHAVLGFVEFGMPLHRRDPGAAARAALVPDGLDDAALGAARFDDKALGQRFDGLVVHAVDAAWLRQQFGQTRLRLDVQPVKQPVIGLHVLVPQGAGGLAADVLVQAAAKGHVDQLQAPANAECRLARCDKGLEQRDFVVVAQLVAGPFGAQRLLAVVARPEVGAAVHDDAIEPLRVVGQRHVAARGVPRGAGNQHRHRAARHDPVRDRLLQVVQGLAGKRAAPRVGMEKAGADADFQTFHGYIACANSRSKSAWLQGRTLVRWQMSWLASSTRRGNWLGWTWWAASPPLMPMRVLSALSQGAKAAPPPSIRQAWASRSNLSGAASRFQAMTVSSISALARPWCRSQTAPSACAHECTAPRSFWKAMAPIMEAIIMSLRASKSPGSLTAVYNAAAAMRVPSSAMPSHSGW